MAVTSSSVAAEPRAISLGPLKMEIRTIEAENADTSGTITAEALTTVKFAIITGLEQTADPTYDGKEVTIAFTDPAATVVGQVILLGV